MTYRKRSGIHPNGTPTHAHLDPLKTNRERVRAWILLLFLMVSAACSSCGDDTPDGPLGGMTRSAIIALDGDPNGLFLSDGVLYIADDNGNRILRWSDADGFLPAIALPPETDPSGPGLGQVVRMMNGDILVTRFGYGRRGGVWQIPSDGAPSLVPNLGVERRRIGLAVGPDGSLFTAWFEGPADARVGGVSRLALDGSGESDIDTSFEKPVGLLVEEGALLVADQAQQRVARVLLSGGPPQTLASPPSADLLARSPSGSLFTGGRAGEVYRIFPSGEWSVIQGGMQEVRGVAYDATHRRLFVAEHDPDESDGLEHRLHVLPVEP